MKKTTEWVCPKCGENIYLTERECTVEDMMANIEVSCDICGAKWNEYFELTYHGYACEGVDYDENGKEVEFNEVNSSAEN